MGIWQEKNLNYLLTQRKEQVIIQPEMEYSLVTISKKGEVRLREKKKGALISATKGYVAKSGDFIYSRLSVHTGAFGIVPPELDQALITNEMPCFEIDEKQIYPKILIYLIGLPQFLWQLKQLAKGMGRVRIKESMILALPVLLPPLTEQKTLVKKIDDTKSYQINLTAELAYQQTLLKKLRQSIMQEAIDGKLTADWRQQNPDVESASELLERIQAERKQLIKDKKIKKQKPLPPISEEEKPFELPKGWFFSRPGELVKNEPYSLGIGPFGSDLLVSDYSHIGVPLIFVKNITNDNFDLNLRYVSEEKARQLKSHSVSTGFIVITKMGDPPGTATIYKNKANRVGILTADCIKFGVHEKLDSKYILFSMQSNFIQSQLGILSKGMGRKKLSLKRFRTILIPIPPILEQKAIVKKVEKLLTLCDQLETQISNNQTHSKNLMQSVLKEAFAINIEKPKESKVIELKPRREDYYKRTLLAVEIVDQLHKEPTLGHLKLQKLIFLCQRTENMQLPTNFLQQAAGPYDPAMARSIDMQLKKKKWFEYQKNEFLKYKQLEDAGAHKEDFNKYFAKEFVGIQFLIDTFRKAKSDQLEIVATLYACWENLLKQGISYSEALLVERFYDWSEEKVKYEEERIRKAITWMQEKNIAPNS